MSEEEPNNEFRSIRAWAEDDRPREKMLLKGRMALSDAELIAILLGSGSRNETAVDLAKRVLHSVGNDLTRLSRLDLKELMRFKGIGEAKAITIAAALELGRRRKESEPVKRPRISSSEQAYKHILPFMADLRHEEFWVVLFSASRHVIGTYQVSKGGVNSTIVDSRIVFKTALDHLAVSIMLFHNHPSGALKPSKGDIDLTKRMRLAGLAIGINIDDHLIVTDQGYYSFADNNLLD